MFLGRFNCFLNDSDLNDREQINSPGFSVQQSSVLRDLQLQSGLDVQECLVLLTLALQIGTELNYLLLQDGDLGVQKTQVFFSFKTFVSYILHF